jgi:hypothetical protein
MRYVLVLIFFAIAIQAQEKRPIGIITHEEADQLRDHHEYALLIAGIHASAKQGIPAGNQAVADRRTRAGIAKNAAFIAYLDRTAKGDSIVILPLEEREVLIQKSIAILRECQTSIPQLSITTPNAYEDWQWHSKEFIDLLSAYDVLRGIPEISPMTLDSIEKRLAIFAVTFHREATKSVFGFTFFGTIRNNHALMTAGAIGMAGAVLYDFQSLIPEDQPIFWLNTALFAIDDIMFNGNQAQSSKDGKAGYAEGPHYYRYAMLNMLPFFRALHHRFPDTTFVVNQRSIPHPFHDERFKQCNEWLVSILQPDGTYPALGDSFLGMGFPELALTGDSTLVYPFSKSELSSQLNSTVDLRANYCASLMPAALTFDLGLSVNEVAGALVFREREWYAHVIAKHGNPRTAGSGHSQSDMTSFMIWTHGIPIILDPGYLQYSMRDQVGNAQQHNVILVNGEGPPNGAPLQPGGADAFAREYVSIPGMDYARVETSYNGASISRHFWSIAESVLVNIDQCTANTPVTFTHQVHGNGLINGTEQTGIAYWQSNGPSTVISWERDSARVDALWSATPLETFSADSSVHEEGYRKTGIHTALRTHSKPTTNALFGGILHPRARNSMSSLVPILATRDASTLGIAFDYAPQSGGIFIAQTDTIKRKLEGWSREEIGFEAETDAQCTGMWQGPNETDFALMLINATEFTNVESNTRIISANTKTTLAISAIEKGFILYVGDSCVITHDLLALVPFAGSEGYVIKDVQGNVNSWTQQTIAMKGKGYATITYGKPVSVQEERHLESFSVLSDAVFHIPLHWTTQNAELRIFDLTGKEVLRQELEQGTNMAKIDVNRLYPGVYLLGINDGNYTKKCMIHITE